MQIYMPLISILIMLILIIDIELKHLSVMKMILLDLIVYFQI
jgi:hypothetical protein